MKILLSNDDGINSPGIQSLYTSLKDKHHVVIIAPHSEKSGTSHAISMYQPIQCRPFAANMWTCFGTPADCVRLSFHGAIDFEPELVIGGINKGANLGTDIIYSGTAAVARQAVLFNCPGIAVSLVHESPAPDFKNSAEFIAARLEKILSSWSKDHFININIPEGSLDNSDTLITFPGSRRYRGRFARMRGAWGDDYFFSEGQALQGLHEEGNDFEAIKHGNISVSPVAIEPQAVDLSIYKKEFNQQANGQSA